MREVDLRTPKLSKSAHATSPFDPQRKCAIFDQRQSCNCSEIYFWRDMLIIIIAEKLIGRRQHYGSCAISSCKDR